MGGARATTSRLPALLALIVVLLAWCAPSAGADTAVRLLGAQLARNAAGKIISRLPATQPFSGESTVLPLIETNGTRLRVRLPGNGSPVGWIDSRGTELIAIHYRMEVNRTTRTANLVRDGLPAGQFRIVVGKPSTPTPLGQYYIAEAVQQSPHSQLGPWALSTSAIGKASELGLGLHVALHGANELPDRLGSAKSHGCIRFADSAIRRLAQLLVPGSLITIR